MTIDTLQFSLKSLRMGGMATNLSIRYQEARSHELDYLDFLSNLVSDELARRQGNLLNRRIKPARFPQLKTIDDFDFDFNMTIKKKDILSLCNSNFIFKNNNIHILRYITFSRRIYETCYIRTCQVIQLKRSYPEGLLHTT